MAENLGAIRYDVEVGTAGMLKAETVVGKSTTNVANDFKKIDAAAKNTSTQMTKAAVGVKKGVQANLGQAGIQVQQFVGQLQGGQSAMVALAQQSADLGIVLGAPLIGVIVSLGAVLLGTLLPSLMSNKTSADALEKSIEKVKAVMTLGADGVVNYADEMRELNKVSQQLAKIKLAEAIINQNEVIKNSSKAIIESAEATSKAYKSTFSELRNLTESVAKDIGGDMNDVAEAIRGGQNIGTAGSYLNRDLDLIAKKFKITRSEALELGLAMSDVIKKGDAVSIKSLQNVTEDLAEAYGYSNDKITKLASGMVKYFIASNQATDGVNELRMALFGEGQEIDKNTEITKDATSTAMNMTLSLIEQKVALEQGERAALAFRLQMQGIEESQKAQILALFDANKATKENAEASKAAAKIKSDAIDDEIDGYIKLADQVVKAENAKKEKLTTQVQSIGLTPLEQIQAQYEAEKALLEQAESEKIEIVGSYADRYKQIEAEKQERIKGLQSETNEFMENAFGNLETQIAGTMAQVITGAKDGREAMSALANTILTQVIGAVVQWGIAEVTKLFTVESAEKGMQAANAAATAASVSAQVGMNTALAAQNAFMATAAIPIIGPALAPAAAAAAGATSAALGASAVPLAPLAGAREFGGPVSNGMYRVNETGIPEVYSQGGKDYLMNTKNANITPLDKAGGGQQAWSVNIENYGADKVYATIDEVNKAVKVGIAII